MARVDDGGVMPDPPFPITELVEHVTELLAEAATFKASMGAVNWGDLSVRDVERRVSVLCPEDGECYIVLVEEASPESRLAEWLNERLDGVRFPGVHVECEW